VGTTKKKKKKKKRVVWGLGFFFLGPRPPYKKTGEKYTPAKQSTKGTEKKRKAREKPSNKGGGLGRLGKIKLFTGFWKKNLARSTNFPVTKKTGGGGARSPKIQKGGGKIGNT